MGRGDSWLQVTAIGIKKIGIFQVIGNKATREGVNGGSMD